MSDATGANLPEPEKVMMQMQAIMGALMDTVRPVVANQVRQVLERNETIVYQSAPALDHLTTEIVDAIMPHLLPTPPDFD